MKPESKPPAARRFIPLVLTVFVWSIGDAHGSDVGRSLEPMPLFVRVVMLGFTLRSMLVLWDLWRERFPKSKATTTTRFAIGWGWLREIPLASTLLALAVAEVWIRNARSPLPIIFDQRQQLTIVALVSVGLGWPLGWVLFKRLPLKLPAPGIALSLQGEGLDIAQKGKSMHLPWHSLHNVTLDSRMSWSWLEGAHKVESLTISHLDKGTATLDGGWLASDLSSVQQAIRAGAVQAGHTLRSTDNQDTV